MSASALGAHHSHFVLYCLCVTRLPPTCLSPGSSPSVPRLLSSWSSPSLCGESLHRPHLPQCLLLSSSCSLLLFSHLFSFSFKKCSKEVLGRVKHLFHSQQQHLFLPFLWYIKVFPGRMDVRQSLKLWHINLTKWHNYSWPKYRIMF